MLINTMYCVISLPTRWRDDSPCLHPSPRIDSRASSVWFPGFHTENINFIGKAELGSDFWGKTMLTSVSWLSHLQGTGRKAVGGGDGTER